MMCIRPTLSDLLLSYGIKHTWKTKEKRRLNRQRTKLLDWKAKSSLRLHVRSVLLSHRQHLIAQLSLLQHPESCQEPEENLPMSMFHSSVASPEYARSVHVIMETPIKSISAKLTLHQWRLLQFTFTFHLVFFSFFPKDMGIMNSEILNSGHHF